jgi:hypothetical protein
MDRFSDDREALDFVASRIADAAQRDGVLLSEVERKMLYFSETAWTPPDIWNISDEFDRDYKQHEYEKKISRLIKKAVARARTESSEDFDAWAAALRRLGKKDRYLLVMVKAAGLGRTARSHTWWRLCVACAIAAGLFFLFVWALITLHPVPGIVSARTGHYRSPLSEAISFSIWAFSLALCVLYGLLQLLFGARKVNETVDDYTEWIFGKGKLRK